MAQDNTIKILLAILPCCSPALRPFLYQVEKEINGCMFRGDAFGIAYHAVVRISDGTIAIYPAQHWVVRVPDGSVVVNIAQYRIVGIPHGIAVYLGNEPVVGVPDVSITVDSRHKTIVAVSDFAIRTDGCNDGIVAIPYRLSLNTPQAQHHRQYQYKSLHFS